MHANHGRHFVDDARQDLRYALRTLGRTPMFALTVIATLGLGIGAAVGVFTVVNAVLLRPLPLRDPGRLVIVNAEEVKLHGIVGASWTRFEQLRARTSVFSDLAASVPREFTVTTMDAPVQARGARVTSRFFDVLGVAPALGRAFSPAEDVEGADPVAIVTDAFWRRALHGDPNAVGTAVRIEGRATTIVGVLPPDFHYQFTEREPQVYLTAVFTPTIMTAAQIKNGAGFLEYVARLKPGVTFDQVRAELAAFDAQYRQQFGSYTDAQRYALHAVPFTDNLVGDVRRPLLVLLGAVLLLLLIASANVAHLMLARAAARQREVAVRHALGASAGRLTRQFLTESLLLALAGVALGVFVARVAVAVLASRGPANIPRLSGAAIDGRVLLFAIVSACAAAVVFGIFPALRLRDPAVIDTLKHGRSGGLTRSAGRLHRWIAMSESSVTVVLVILAGLLFESVLRLQAVDVGFTPGHVYAAQIALPRQKYATPAQREALFTAVLRDLQTQPGIDAAGATSYLPMGGSNYGFFFYVEGQPHLGPGRDPVTSVRHVSPDYFRAMNISVREGRAFTDRDVAASAPVVIVNESLARKFFPGVDPVGRHLANSGDGVMREVVGVVGDVRFDGPARSGQQELYMPYMQVPWPSMSLVVSSRLSADAVAGAMRRAVGRLDRDQAVAEIRPMPAVVSQTMAQEQFTSWLLAAFATLAIALAAVGLYGVIAIFVGQRRHEFGIRTALGAQRGQVLWLVLREGAILIGSALVAGVACAVALSGVIRGLLFDVSPLQPSMYVLGAAVLAVIGGLACYVPARRAMAVAPLETLRAE